MEAIAGFSIILNAFLIYYVRSNSEKKYSIEDIDRNIERRDEEYQKLIFQYLRETHGDEGMKSMREQSRYYEIARRMKIIK
jgi:hypothetical protein